MKKIHISTHKRQDVIDITGQVREFLSQEGIGSGLVTVFSPHTTAGITVNENADPSVKQDINSFLKKTIPQNYGFAHSEGNSDAHIKGSLTGFSQTFLVENGKLQLGTWQGIFFMEYDGPRNRKVWLQAVSS